MFGEFFSSLFFLPFFFFFFWCGDEGDDGMGWDGVG